MTQRARTADSPFPQPDGQDLSRALAGDDQAFRRLVEAYESRVAAVTIGMLGDEDAEDVAQEVFIRMHRSVGQFRGEAQLSTWLTRIAINLCLDRLRWRTRRQRRTISLDTEAGQALVPGSGGEDLLDERERARLVRRAVRRLKPAWRAVVVLRWLQGLSTEETAHSLNLPYGTVLSRLSRAMASLRGELGPLLDDGPGRGGRKEAT